MLAVPLDSKEFTIHSSPSWGSRRCLATCLFVPSAEPSCHWLLACGSYFRGSGRHSVSLFLGNTPALPCPNCNKELNIPTVTALVLPARNCIHVCSDERIDKEIEKQLHDRIPGHLTEACQMEFHPTLRGIREPITRQILSFKPLIKSLVKADQEGPLSEFVTDVGLTHSSRFSSLDLWELQGSWKAWVAI